MEDNIRKTIHDYYLNALPKPDASGMKKIIEEVYCKKANVEMEMISYWGFFFGQFRFIRMKTWLVQFILLLMTALKCLQGGEQKIFIACMSAISPMLMLAGINEIFRSQLYDTLEMECSTMYTGKHVFLTRACIIGGMDIVCLSIYCILTRVRLLLPGYMIFLYIIVPFLVTCFGCLWIMNHLKQKEVLYPCYGFGIVIAGIAAALALYYPYLYVISSVWIWGIVFSITLIGIVKELLAWNRSMEKAGLQLRGGENVWK